MDQTLRVSGRVGAYIVLTNVGGLPGSQVYIAPGAPSGIVGASGDVYVNSSNGDFYKRIGALWGAPVANLKGATGSTGATGGPGPTGPSGSAGAAGSQIYTGSGAPSGGLGVNGDFYLDTATSDYYLRAAGAWNLQGNLSGAGFTGPAGGALFGSYPNPGLADGAVTDAKVTDVAYSKITGAPAALPPNGAAGGVLSGTYPSPGLADASVTDAKMVDMAYGKLTGAPSSLPPSGAAGGALSGTYPNPTIPNASITDVQITGLAYSKLTGAPAALPPSGAAGGALSGTYPNPTIPNASIADAQITGLAYSKLSGVPAAFPPNGAAGGDLAGSYPNPTLAPLGVDTPDIADLAVTDAKIGDVAYSKVTGAPASLPPSGAASGSLGGSYPNPSIAPGAVGTTELTAASVTDVKIVGMAYGKLTGAPAALPPSGSAGGSLTGTYPNPTIGTLAVSDAMISALAYTKLTGAPAALPPNGSAGGDLTGTYPNPTVKDFVGSGVSHAHGAVPDPGATPGTAKFLCENAAWSVPPGAVQVENSVVSGHTTLAPSGDAVYKALFTDVRMIAANVAAVVTSSHAVVAADKLLTVSFNGAVSLTLPDPTTGRFHFRVIDTLGSNRETAPITLVRFGSETIAGLPANRTLVTPGGSWDVYSDGGNWVLG